MRIPLLLFPYVVLVTLRIVYCMDLSVLINRACRVYRLSFCPGHEWHSCPPSPEHHSDTHSTPRVWPSFVNASATQVLFVDTPKPEEIEGRAAIPVITRRERYMYLHRILRVGREVG